MRAVGKQLRVSSASSTQRLDLPADTFFTVTQSGGKLLVKSAGGALKGTFASDVYVQGLSGALVEVKDKSGSPDGAYHANGDGFTNLEEYLNSLLPTKI